MEKPATPPAPPLALKLPPQQFAEILSALRGNDTDANSEKRRTTRMSVSAKIAASLYDGKTIGRKIIVLARDISMEGVGILSGVELKRNDLFIAHFPRTQTHVSYLICQAIFVGRMADGLYNMGCRFIGEIPANQIPPDPPKPAA
jgi:hypothetical protein